MTSKRLAVKPAVRVWLEGDGFWCCLEAIAILGGLFSRCKGKPCFGLGVPGSRWYGQDMCVAVQR